MDGVLLQNPADFPRMPPDGHEFPPEYRDPSKIQVKENMWNDLDFYLWLGFFVSKINIVLQFFFLKYQKSLAWCQKCHLLLWPGGLTQFLVLASLWTKNSLIFLKTSSFFTEKYAFFKILHPKRTWPVSLSGAGPFKPPSKIRVIVFKSAVQSDQKFRGFCWFFVILCFFRIPMKIWAESCPLRPQAAWTDQILARTKTTTTISPVQDPLLDRWCVMMKQGKLKFFFCEIGYFNFHFIFSASSVRAKIAMFSNGDPSLTRSLTQNDVRFEETGKSGMISGLLPSGKSGSLTGNGFTMAGSGTKPVFAPRAGLTRMASAGESKMPSNSFGGGGRSQSLMEIHGSSTDFKRSSPTNQVITSGCCCLFSGCRWPACFCRRLSRSWDPTCARTARPACWQKMRHGEDISLLSKGEGQRWTRWKVSWFTRTTKVPPQLGRSTKLARQQPISSRLRHGNRPIAAANTHPHSSGNHSPFILTQPPTIGKISYPDCKFSCLHFFVYVLTVMEGAVMKPRKRQWQPKTTTITRMPPGLLLWPNQMTLTMTLQFPVEDLPSLTGNFNCAFSMTLFT